MTQTKQTGKYRKQLEQTIDWFDGSKERAKKMTDVFKLGNFFEQKEVEGSESLEDRPKEGLAPLLKELLEQPLEFSDKETLEEAMMDEEFGNNFWKSGFSQGQDAMKGHRKCVEAVNEEVDA